MRYYCPRCWQDFPEDVPRCPDCGLEIHQFLSEKDYVEKLILGLDHPQQDTPIRAASILGGIGDVRAVQPLIALIKRTKDVYIATAAVRALGQIGTPEAYDFLQTLRHHEARMVEEAAADVLKQASAQGHAASAKNRETR
jgi:HEAT repeat protein